nr:flagellar hook-associated protein FlgK [Cohnella sp. REN36]
IPSYIERMNNLASSMFEAVNELHRQGYNLDDIANGSHTPVDFFTTKSGAATPANASDFKVNPDIMQSVRKIAIAAK